MTNAVSFLPEDVDTGKADREQRHFLFSGVFSGLVPTLLQANILT